MLEALLGSLLKRQKHAFRFFLRKAGFLAICFWEFDLFSPSKSSYRRQRYNEAWKMVLETCTGMTFVLPEDDASCSGTNTDLKRGLHCFCGQSPERNQRSCHSVDICHYLVFRKELLFFLSCKAFCPFAQLSLWELPSSAGCILQCSEA